MIISEQPIASGASGDCESDVSPTVSTRKYVPTTSVAYAIFIVHGEWVSARPGRMRELTTRANGLQCSGCKTHVLPARLAERKARSSRILALHRSRAPPSRGPLHAFIFGRATWGITPRNRSYTDGATIMSDNKNEAGKKSGEKHDSEKALQEELRREAAEGKGSVGDAAKNNNLSGSSTWETLPDDDATKKGNK